MSQESPSDLDQYAKRMMRSIVLEKIKTNKEPLDINGVNKMFDMMLPVSEFKGNSKDLDNVDNLLDRSIDRVGSIIQKLEQNCAPKECNTVGDLRVVHNNLNIIKGYINKINVDEAKVSNLIEAACYRAIKKNGSSSNCNNSGTDCKIASIDNNISQLDIKIKGMMHSLAKAEESADKIARLERMLH
jgi:hypothetical protein